MTDEDLHAHLIGRQGGRWLFNTPVLVVELDALKRNIVRMAEFAKAHGVKLRPHAKTHKSAEIAGLQISAGAIGACCAKLGEAEALADGGILSGLLITSPVVSTPAIIRLHTLNRRTRDLMVVVDHPQNARRLADPTLGETPLKVLIDVDPGMRRTGVASPEAAVDLLHAIRAEPALEYAGVQFYCGDLQHVEAYAERRAAMQPRAAYLKTVIAALAGAGGAPGIVTGGGTGTHAIDVGLGVFTELQAGSYVFMDAQYGDCALRGDEAQPFETALTVDARVVSANAPGQVTLDAGLKAFATDAGPPIPLAGAPEGSTYRFMGDEHGALITGDAPPPALGEVVTLAAPHCDPTVNLYDSFHVVQGDTLRALWPISGRGRGR